MVMREDIQDVTHMTKRYNRVWPDPNQQVKKKLFTPFVELSRQGGIAACHGKQGV